MSKVHTDKVECCQFTPNGRQIVSIGRDHLIKVIDFYTYKVLATIEHPDLNIPSAGSLFGISPNGKFLAVGN